MKTLLTLFAVVMFGSVSHALAANNPPPVGILKNAARAANSSPRVAVAEQTSTVESNGPAITDLGIGASSPVRQEIRLEQDSAVADYGLQKVHFPADLTEAPITITTPDGRKLYCRATFLALHDTASGQNLLLGEVQKSIGQLVGDNTILYPDALDTVNADIRYRYTKHSLEQDIILHEGIRLPAEFQSENVRLEVWSEWVDTMPDAKETKMIDLRPDAAVGKQAAVPNTDERLNFGAMRIADGFAFGIQTEQDKTPVAKMFGKIEGRNWLIERVDFVALKPKLEKLPKPQASLSPNRIKTDRSQLVQSLHARTASKSSGKIKRMAMSRYSDRDSLVLDFVIISSVPVPADVISWWPAGGNANDAIIATGNNGTWNGTAAYTSGKVGQGFSLTGVNSVTIPNSASLNPTSGLTVEGWVWVQTNANDYQAIFVKGDINSDLSHILFLDPDNRIYSGIDSWYYVQSTNSLSTNTWHHIAMTYETNSETLNVYVNGQLDGTGWIGNTLSQYAVTEPARIGDAGSSWYPFTGRVDELALYGRALSSSEILSIYNAGAAGKNNPNCTPPATNIVAWWSGDGNGYDLARTNHATLSSATYESAVVSQGFNFDGINDSVIAADDNALNLATTDDDVTIEAWISPLTNTTTYGVMTVVSKRHSPNSSTATGYELFLINGVPGFQIANGTSVANFIATNHLRNGYHHVAVTMDRNVTTGGKIYVDGVPVLTFNPTVLSVSLSNNAPVRIGVHPQPGFNGWYKGVIDEPTIYRRALNGSEITAIYTAGSAGKCKVDNDSDGLTDLQETFLDTNPNDSDSDDDGLTDGDEVLVQHTNPNNQDSDGDGVIDQPFKVLIVHHK